MICCGLPTRMELRSIASSSVWKTGVTPTFLNSSSRALKIGR